MKNADAHPLAPSRHCNTGALIVTYHYIREGAGSSAGLHPLSPADFRRQLDLLVDRYRIWPLAQIVATVAEGASPPPDVCALTFDDGFIEHYTVAFPELRDRGICGTFFASSSASLDGELLDVHKVQRIVAAASVEQINSRLGALLAMRGEPDLFASLQRRQANSTETSRFDEPKLRHLKRALQRDLPDGLRQEVVHALYTDLVDAPQRTTATELYAMLPQLREMASGGMEIGAHSATHRWMTALGEAELEREFSESRRLVCEVYGSWHPSAVFCYPYGGRSIEVEQEARRYGFVAGVSTEPTRVGPVARLLALPRIDTTQVLDFMGRES